MAKINIMGVKRGDINHQVHVVLTEQQEIEGEPQEIPLGEAFVVIPDGMKPAKAKTMIIGAAQGIMAKHKEATKIRERLQQVEFPEIEG